jgi:hypothetical protein
MVAPTFAATSSSWPSRLASASSWITEDYPATGEYKRVYAIHDLRQLLFLAGLRRKLDPTAEALFTNWSLAVPWNPTERRYSPAGTVTREDAVDILIAVRNPKDGVLAWLQKRW